jgi:FlaA1/EpsC-like NDP-sugar epimerase
MNRLQRRYLVFPVDLVFMVVSFFLAHWIRYENLRFLDDINLFITSLIIVVSVRSIIFIFSGIYRSLWAYASIHDLVEIIKTTIFSSLVSTIALLFYNRFSQLSRMVPVLDTLLLLSFLCLRSFSWRMLRDEIFRKKSLSEGFVPILLVGAGKLGATFLSEIRRHENLNLLPIGFIDEDTSKIGGHIQGVPILGNLDILEHLILSHSVKQVIITMNQPDGRIVSRVMKICEELKVQYKILPNFNDILNETPKINQLREVEVQDLLGRAAVNLEIDNIKSYLQGKSILITGAGGSIGSELCRQVMFF